MALLLAMYQKMKLVREQNQLSYKLANYTTKVDRIHNNITRVQKRYESLFKRLEQQSKRAETNAKQYWTNIANCGSFGGGMGSMIGGMLGGSMGSMVGGVAGNLIASIFETNNIDYKTQMEAFNNGTMTDEEKATFTKQYNQAQQIANYTMQQQQQWANNMMQQAITNIQAKLECDQAALEAEQEAVIQPLEYEETMMELDKQQTEDRLARIKANLESYKQLASDEAKNAAPTFGLG